MKRHLKCMAAAVLLSWLAPAGAIEPEDFASGIELATTTPRPLLELSLPDAVYGGVTRADLADLRVFNAEGLAVPHALCAAAATLPGTAPRFVDQPLEVFSLRAAPGAGNGARVDVRVSTPEDTDVRVQVQGNGAPGAAKTELSGYVINAEATQWPIRALRLRWQTADGASTVSVRVEASDDLDRWWTVVAQTTLLRVGNAGGTLERLRIALPQARYRYLRLVRADAGPAPDVSQVIAETVQTAPADEAPFVWIEPQPQARVGEDGFAFDAARRAPVQIARIGLPSANMALQARLQSRATKEAAWKTQWQGEVFALLGDNRARQNADLRFAAVADPLWRVEITEGRESLGEGRPTLQLGYRPDRLRFLAQGDGPFVLAYGSARAEPARRRDCADLLKQLPGTELANLIGTAQPGSPRELGGEDALKPAPAPLPWRQVALWGVLVLAALLLVAMARSLLRRARG
ncbi:MAG: DUF3999 domain-containing protein [Sinimarinibacterium sp.]|jgi:hypothetical protein